MNAPMHKKRQIKVKTGEEGEWEKVSDINLTKFQSFRIVMKFYALK